MRQPLEPYTPNVGEVKLLAIKRGDMVKPLRDHYMSPIKDRPTTHRELVKVLDKRKTYPINEYDSIAGTGWMIDDMGMQRPVTSAYFRKVRNHIKSNAR